MKNKIVGILVCMLVIATSVPLVISVTNDAIDTQGSDHPFIGRIALSTLSKSDSFTNNLIDVNVPNHPLSYMGNGDWIEAQKITIPDGAIDFFGGDIALDGDTALIAAPGDDNLNGSVYVFTRVWSCDGATWIQQQKLTPSDPGVNDCFGVRVALQGDTALIGASDELSQDDPGAVYVFTRSGTNWTEQQILTPPDGDPLDLFADPALDGDTAIIGALWDDDMGVDAGAAYVFTRTGTTWAQQAKFYPTDAAAGEWFGYSIDLDGDTALISTYDWWNDTVTPGAAYVFTRTGTTWTQQAKLVGSDTLPGDTFGIDVALDDDTAIVGAVNDCEQGDYSGSVFVFTRTGSTWVQEAKLLQSNGTKYDWFGNSVSLEGDTALIAAPNEEEGNIDARGAAYVFTRTGTTWTEKQRLIASDGIRFDYFSGPLCLNGDTAFFGAVWATYGQGPNSGSVYVFVKTNLTFSINGGLGINLKITNNGMVPVNGVPWQIHMEGGILGMINKTVNGTIDIPLGDTVTVKTGMLLGFGAISIVAKVADEEQTATGTQFVIFSLVK
ncbi:MAG: FG-GAP repeat protein [Candidatus Thermoplasmatota archaeon]|jgi:hypothetical protein|nr:FG-GAP repeat protein [Candidatus Thermoplasmatota archaeon]